jgi:hypothetical protein
MQPGEPESSTNRKGGPPNCQDHYTTIPGLSVKKRFGNPDSSAGVIHVIIIEVVYALFVWKKGCGL